MREILFRGLDINSQWCYGLLAIIKTNQMKNVKAGYYISNDIGSPFAYQVRPETDCAGFLTYYGVETVIGNIYENKELLNEQPA